MEELKERTEGKKKFGFVKEINKQEYVREVNEAEKGTNVVLLLYENQNEISLKLAAILDEMSIKHRHVKFVKIEARKCVENFKEEHVPAIFVYRDGEMVSQYLQVGAVLGGKKISFDIVEFFLARNKLVESELDEDPRDKLFKIKRKHKNDDESSSEDDREYTRNHYKDKIKY